VNVPASGSETYMKKYMGNFGTVEFSNLGLFQLRKGTGKRVEEERL
jgi:hypothetical protein